MPDETGSSGNAGSFEQVVLPHLDAAYNLARWLVRNTTMRRTSSRKLICARSNSSAAIREAMPAPGS